MKSLSRLTLIFLCWMAGFLLFEPALKAAASNPTIAQTATTPPAVGELLRRILPHGRDAQRFRCILQSDSSRTEYFSISSNRQTVTVQANTLSALTQGIHWYLQHHLGQSISWSNWQLRLPRRLPIVPLETHEARVEHRYYLNFCTHSYTMAFWDWPRWEREIDWMALHGVNLPLIITGMEQVWRSMLQNSYGYRGLEGVNKFVTGPAYYGWFLMNNMTEWGGPQSEGWYDQRKVLARRIFARLSSLGITPVIPGYVGMVPADFLSHADSSKVQQWRSDDIVDGGRWNAFVRPAFVNHPQRLSEMAAHYYAAVHREFGDVLSTHYYAIDPFHEGGIPSAVAHPQQSVQAMWQSLERYDSQAVWVAQHWQHNPMPIVTHTIPRGRLLILDLHGDSKGSVQCDGHHTDSLHQPHDWVWGMVNNFGGNVGLFGRLEQMLATLNAAFDQRQSTQLRGVGAIPEGIEDNPILFELLYILPWSNQRYTLDTWLSTYVRLRYGAAPGTAEHSVLLSAWQRLARSIYNCPSPRQQGTTESVFLMRPDSAPRTVSTWAFSSWYWDFDQIRMAAQEMLSVSKDFQHHPNYRHDLVDILRQCLADKGKTLLDSYRTAANPDTVAQQFLDLLLDQDRLLGTLPEFRLGTWLEQARSWATTEVERQRYEQNARMLLTTWGDREQCDRGRLHDYGNREWNGLLSSYYYPRWKRFFDARRYNAQSLPPSGTWFTDYEWPFVIADSTAEAHQHLPSADAPWRYGSFSSTPEGDPIQLARTLWRKHFSDGRRH